MAQPTSQFDLFAATGKKKEGSLLRLKGEPGIYYATPDKKLYRILEPNLLSQFAGLPDKTVSRKNLIDNYELSGDVTSSGLVDRALPKEQTKTITQDERREALQKVYEARPDLQNAFDPETWQGKGEYSNVTLEDWAMVYGPKLYPEELAGYRPANLVRQSYLEAIGREPSEAEIQQGADSVLTLRTNYDQLVQDLRTSPEYENLSPAQKLDIAAKWNAAAPSGENYPAFKSFYSDPAETAKRLGKDEADLTPADMLTDEGKNALKNVKQEYLPYFRSELSDIIGKEEANKIFGEELPAEAIRPGATDYERYGQLGVGEQRAEQELERTQTIASEDIGTAKESLERNYDEIVRRSKMRADVAGTGRGGQAKKILEQLAIDKQTRETGLQRGVGREAGEEVVQKFYPGYQQEVEGRIPQAYAQTKEDITEQRRLAVREIGTEGRAVTPSLQGAMIGREQESYKRYLRNLYKHEKTAPRKNIYGFSP